MTKTILQQDDCAPDSYASFCAQFQKIMGITVSEFEAQSIRVDLDDSIVYESPTHILSISADDPYWTLEEKVITTLVAYIGEHVGQVEIKDAESEIDRMNKQQGTTIWHADDSDFLYVPDETGGEDDFDAPLNPCPKEQGYVWITSSFNHQ
jgi:hypothetical protein